MLLKADNVGVEEGGPGLQREEYAMHDDTAEAKEHKLLQQQQQQQQQQQRTVLEPTCNMLANELSRIAQTYKPLPAP